MNRFIRTSRKTAWGFAVALVTCALGMLITRAALAEFNHNYVINRAAGVFFTQRGQDFFRKELPYILQRNGLDLTQGKRKLWAYEAEKELDLDRLPPGLQAYSPLFHFLRDNIKNWLSNMSLNNPRFAVQVRNAGYELDGLQLGLRVDMGLSGTVEGHGIGLIVEASIPRLRISADGIRGRDLNNPLFGTFGINNPWLELRDARPLQISIPVRVEITDGGLIQLETLSVSTNLDRVAFASGQDRKLVLPTVQVQLGDHVGTLDQRPLEEALRQKERELVQLGQRHLKDFIEKELPIYLNRFVYNHLKKSFELISQINAPGTYPMGNGAKLDMAFRPTEIGIDSQFLFLNLEGYIADPNVTWDEKLPATTRPNPPALGGMDASRYDLAIAVSQDVVNRAIELGFRRGGLSRQAATRKGQVYRVVTAPVFEASQHGHGKIRVTIELVGKGWGEWVALKDPFRLDLVLDVTVRISPKGNAFDIYPNYIEKATLAGKYKTWVPVDGKIAEGLAKGIRDANEDFVVFPKPLAEGIAVPPELFKIPVNLTHVEVDPAGYIDLFMEYGDRR